MAAVQEKLDQALAQLGQVSEGLTAVASGVDGAMSNAVAGLNNKLDAVASQTAQNGSGLSALQSQVAGIAQELAALKAQIVGENS